MRLFDGFLNNEILSHSKWAIEFVAVYVDFFSRTYGNRKFLPFFRIIFVFTEKDAHISDVSVSFMSMAWIKFSHENSLRWNAFTWRKLQYVRFNDIEARLICSIDPIIKKKNLQNWKSFSNRDFFAKHGSVRLD